jgi:hypothetical protein
MALLPHYVLSLIRTRVSGIALRDRLLAFTLSFTNMRLPSVNISLSLTFTLSFPLVYKGRCSPLPLLFILLYLQPPLITFTVRSLQHGSTSSAWSLG